MEKKVIEFLATYPSGYMSSKKSHCIDKLSNQVHSLYFRLCYSAPGNYLEGKQTANPVRKPLGAAVYPLHDLLTAAPSSDQQEEKDLQMEVYT